MSEGDPTPQAVKPTAADWPELLQLLDEALQLEEARLPAWLATLPEPRQAQLRALLEGRGDIKTRQFLARPATLPAPEVSGGVAEPGQRVGPWRLLHEIGRGGMAWVWLAERADGQGQRRVALKLPRLGWAPGLAERMARERDILATLEHPNIARLYDAGSDEQGRPWLAMEYVQGRRIDRHCRELDLSLRQRVTLVLQVADALAYAHQRLVIHRDLKPANILVTPQGQVRLLDFGIARLVPGDAQAQSVFTQDGMQALTPAYASPEQVLGQTLTAASDVYGLAVVAYELFTGARPYAVTRTSAAELEQAILSADIAAPSSRAASAEVSRELRGDLDAVLLMALKREAAERYPSMEAFSADLRRALNHEPVKAQRDSAWYRLRRFVRRRRLESGLALAVLAAIPAGAGAQVAVMLTLAAGAGATLWQARKAQASAQAAREAAQLAEKVKRASLALFQDADSGAGTGQDTRAIDLLKAAALRLEGDASLPPLVRAELQVAVAFSLLGLGDSEAAEPTARSALALVRRTGTQAPVLTEALLVHGEALDSRGHSVQASAELEEALRAARREANAEREVRALNRLSSALISQGQNARALALAEASLAVCDARPHEVSALWQCYSAGNLANTRKAMGLRYMAPAERALEGALQHAQGRETLPVIENGLLLAAAMIDEGDAREGLARLRRLVEAMPPLSGHTHPHLSVAFTWLGLAELDLGHPLAAIEAFERSLSILTVNEGDSSFSVGLLCLRVATAAMRQRPAGAERAVTAARRAMVIADLFGEQGQALGRSARSLLALALALAGRMEASREAAEPLLAGEADLSVAERLRLAACEALHGHSPPGPMVWGEALETSLASLPPLKTGALLVQAAEVAVAAGDRGWAWRALDRAHRLLHAAQDSDSPDLARLAELRASVSEIGVEPQPASR